jgi:hypothetical protein
MRDDPAMRTTPDIADEALRAAKAKEIGAKRPTMKLVEDLRDEA